MAPDPAAALHRTQPVHALVWEALELATAHARDYLIQFDHHLDPYLAADLTRFHAKRELNRLSVEAGIDLEPRDVPNNGLRVRLAKDELWILKAFHGGVPSPGRSRRRQEVWQQPLFEWAELTGQRLLVLWDVDHRYELTEISLVRPRGGGADPTSGEALWSVPLPRPDLGSRPTQSKVQTILTLDDLDTVRLPRPEQTGTDAVGDDLR